ncbi:glycosylphosphatidylinositol anchor biosynthesis [Ceratobasidium sp. UAMH 11750]|nr:glycosylphosphatidylinositol anchor biosynthesis [Ceratobasidium sp. UAMH 11750]
METSLTTMALVFWPLPGSRSRPRTRVALGLAALSCIIRPTGGVLWVFLGLELAWRWRSSASRIGSLVFDVSFVGIAALAVTVAVDSMYYGAFTLTPISFVRTNILSGTARFYGVNSFHYYLTQGLPIILGPALPFALHGVWMRLRPASAQPSSWRYNPDLSILFGLVAWTILVYSCLAHKEWRFIHALLPILHIFAADSLIGLGARTVVHNKPASPPTRNQPKLPSIRPSHLAFLLGVSLPLNIYLIHVHGSAQVIATRYLHSLGQDRSRVKSIGVLMPCHSIPWQSHLHLPHLGRKDGGSRLWALGCEPPLGLNSTQLERYTSQTDVFFDTIGPIAYFQKYFPQDVDPTFPPSPAPYTIPGNLPPENGWRHTWPSHLLMFGALEDQPSSPSEVITVKEKLEELGYKVIKRIGNGWEEDERRKGGVVVWGWAGRVL